MLITELVSNAVRYGGPPIEVELNCVEEAGVLLSVTDGSPHLPVVQEVGPSGLGGRGVRLMEVLSAEWGVQRYHRSDRDDRDDRVHPGSTQRRRHGGHRGAGCSGQGDVDGPDHGVDTDAMPAKTVWCRLTR